MAGDCQNSLYKLKQNVDAMFKWGTFFVLMYTTRYLIWMADILVKLNHACYHYRL